MINRKTIGAKAVMHIRLPAEIVRTQGAREVEVEKGIMSILEEIEIRDEKETEHMIINVISTNTTNTMTITTDLIIEIEVETDLTEVMINIGKIIDCQDIDIHRFSNYFL